MKDLAENVDGKTFFLSVMLIWKIIKVMDKRRASPDSLEPGQATNTMK